MDSQITVSLKGLLVAAVAALALVTAFLLGSQGGPTTPAASAADAPAPAAAKPGRIQMVGVGKASAVPDQLSFSLSVSDKQPALDDALAGSSARLKRVLAALAEFGVRTQDVQTTGLQMYPVYDYHSYAPPTLTGYRVTQRAQVKVRDLTQGGKAIAAAINTGGDSVRARNIELGFSDPDALVAQARDAAVEAATAKAEQYAGATDQSLGRVLTVRELSNPGRQVRPQAYEMSYRDAAAATVKGALPIRAGKNDLSVRVQVVWTFGD